MASDQNMIDALSEVLRDGETLLYPIFGTVRQGPFQQFAYFAFTETHFLVAYLTTGNIVTDVERIPLDIRSVKVKKSKILNEYKISILFENKKSFEISTFLKILKIKSQKDNLPLFLERLKSNSKKQAKSLGDIEGQKIRWQYFNTWIYTMLAFIPAVPVMIIMQELRKGNFDIWNTIIEMSGAVPVIAVLYGVFIGPFIVLSIFNRFCFGKILGVTDDNMLFLENREVPIKEILEIVYHPRVMLRTKISIPYATFVVRSSENETVAFDVIHFPMYGLMTIKKHNKEIKLKCDKFIWFLLLCPTVISAIIGFLLG